MLEAELATDLPALYLHCGDVPQILLNVLLNARDTLVDKLAGPSCVEWSPRIRVEATALPASAPPLDSTKPSPSAWIKFTCRDNGTGMASDVLERIFGPSYTTKPVGQGTGFGRATVRHLVTEMGGCVEVSCEQRRQFH